VPVISNRTGEIDEVRYDPFAANEDPYPTYRLLRDRAPVYYNDGRNIWALSRFEDVQLAARDWQTFTTRPSVDLDDTGGFFDPGNMIDADPPKHDRLRDSVRAVFAPRRIRDLESSIRMRARAATEVMIEHREADVAVELAWTLPGHVICDLLGFPESDHPLLIGWFMQMVARIPGQVDVPDVAWAANREMREYVDEAVASRRKRPTDDLLTVIAAAERNGVLGASESRSLPIHLFFAGISTTSGLISRSLLLLARHPEQRRMLAGDMTLLPAAVEELLRYEAPIQWLARSVTRDVELHDMTIPEGARVLLMWGSANRDERRWPDADALDIMRPPSRNLAFGDGIHHCLGAPLARLEGRLVLEEFLSRVDYEISGRPVPLYTPAERALANLPVRVLP
jgi:cytochrome P450